MLKVSENKRYITRNGEPFFILSDTVWSTFTNASIDEWEYYLDYRKQQGFNTVQINVLPQWDRSSSKNDLKAFDVIDNCIVKFNEDYFIRAQEMVQIAKDFGFEVMLVLMWSNYVKGTWAGDFELSPYFTSDVMKSYCKIIHKYFNEYNPVYIISGDTDFRVDSTELYNHCLNEMSELSPDSLKVMHIRGRLMDLPKEIKCNSNLDLYFYQSGHNSSHLDMPYLLAEEFYNKKPTKPVINSEPCYEQISYSRHVYGKFRQEDVRKAAWQSVVSGAFAGISYGAHGVWSWHTENENFGTELGEAFSTPNDWKIALTFEGANDYVHLKEFVNDNKMYLMKPNQDLIVDNSCEIRVCEDELKVIIYMPTNVRIKIKGNYNINNSYCLDLENYDKYKLISKNNTNDLTVIEETRALRDVVYVVYK